MSGRTLAKRADWMRFPETAYDTTTSDTEWIEGLISLLQPILVRTIGVAFQAFDYDDDPCRPTVSLTTDVRPIWHGADMERWVEEMRPFARFVMYPPTLVTTHRELEAILPAEAVHLVRRYHAALASDDCLGMVLHPLPGIVVVVSALYDEPIKLTRYERRLLTQIGLHIETGYRLRKRPGLVRAELTSDGQVIGRAAKASPAPTVLESHGRRVAEARSRRRRTSSDALDLWTSLIAGRLTLVPNARGAKRGYVVIENPVETHPLHALSRSERDVLSLAARGLSTKMVAYGLGISPSAVSTSLATAASKVGLASRTELVRVAAILAQDPRSTESDARLTAAESEILELLQLGISNIEIARMRGRSVHTIANQVASLLQKTGSSSRRALIARVAVTGRRAFHEPSRLDRDRDRDLDLG